MLPTGHACSLEEPPRGALAMALHAISLLTQRRLIDDIERHRDDAKLIVLPPPCPLGTQPIDFDHADDLIDRGWPERASSSTGRRGPSTDPDAHAPPRHRHATSTIGRSGPLASRKRARLARAQGGSTMNRNSPTGRRTPLAHARGPDRCRRRARRSRLLGTHREPRRGESTTTPPSQPRPRGKPRSGRHAQAITSPGPPGDIACAGEEEEGGYGCNGSTVGASQTTARPASRRLATTTDPPSHPADGGHPQHWNHRAVPAPLPLSKPERVFRRARTRRSGWPDRRARGAP